MIHCGESQRRRKPVVVEAIIWLQLRGLTDGETRKGAATGEFEHGRVPRQEARSSFCACRFGDRSAAARWTTSSSTAVSSTPSALAATRMKAAEPKMAPALRSRHTAEGRPHSRAGDAAGGRRERRRSARRPRQEGCDGKADLERQQAEYCKKNYEDAKAHGDETAADLAAGPLGPCRGSVLTAIEKWNKSEE